MMHGQEHILFIPPLYLLLVPKDGAEIINYGIPSTFEFLLPIGKRLFIEMVLTSLLPRSRGKDDGRGQRGQTVDDRIRGGRRQVFSDFEAYRQVKGPVEPDRLFQVRLPEFALVDV